MIYLDVTPSATTVAAGMDLHFEVRFSQFQENWSFNNGDGEPTADIGFQYWRQSYYELWHDTLTDLRLDLGATGGPTTQRLTRPGALPGTDYQSSWMASLRFDQPGTYWVTASAQATQDKVLRIGATTGTRECVGFDNSVQCTSWSFQDEILDDRAWTEVTSATSLAVQVVVVPEPATWVLAVVGLAGLIGLARRPR